LESTARPHIESPPSLFFPHRIFSGHKRTAGSRAFDFRGAQARLCRTPAADCAQFCGGSNARVCGAIGARGAAPHCLQCAGGNAGNAEDFSDFQGHRGRSEEECSCRPRRRGLYTPTLRLAMWHAFADTRGLRRRKRRVFAGVKCPSYCTSNQLAAPLASRTCSNTCITIMRPTTLQHHSHDTLYIHTHGIPTPALLPSSMVQTQI
jgi:hypothetical protein